MIEEENALEMIMANVRTVWCELCSNPYDVDLNTEKSTCPECGHVEGDDTGEREVEDYWD